MASDICRCHRATFARGGEFRPTNRSPGGHTQPGRGRVWDQRRGPWKRVPVVVKRGPAAEVNGKRRRPRLASARLGGPVSISARAEPNLRTRARARGRRRSPRGRRPVPAATCTPSGSPPADRPSGTSVTGTPARLNMAAGVSSHRPPDRACRGGARRVDAADAGAPRRRSPRRAPRPSVARRPALALARRRPALAGASRRPARTGSASVCGPPRRSSAATSAAARRPPRQQVARASAGRRPEAWPETAARHAASSAARPAG